jgi:hypothetical protein
MAERKKFATIDEVIIIVNEHFAGFDQTYFTDKMKKLKKRWTKCKKNEQKGDYIEKTDFAQNYNVLLLGSKLIKQRKYCQIFG